MEAKDEDPVVQGGEGDGDAGEERDRADYTLSGGVGQVG